MTEDEFRNGRKREVRFYIRNKERGYLGNSFMWYAKGGRGYTAYLNHAERFSKDEAERMVKETPEKWESYQCDLIDRRANLIFDSQDVGSLEHVVRDGSAFIDAREILGGR